MSVGLTKFLEGMDSSLTAGLAATLAGMSLTAASLLANLVKTQSDRLTVLRAARSTTRDAKEAAEATSDYGRIVTTKHAAEQASEEYERAVKDAEGLKKAFKALLVGFAAFACNLVESLTIDPNVGEALLNESGLPKVGAFFSSGTYPEWLCADVALSMGSLGIGVSALCYAASKMMKLVPKL